MKHIFHHPPADLTGKRYWRSLEEQAESPEFTTWLEREFPAGAQEMEIDGVSRRNFLQLMGASMALAGFGMSGCRRPVGHITPYSKSLEWIIPGKSLLFATAMPGRRGAMPLVITTHEGRPTKIEGNPLHPASNGSTDAFAQASVLDLYDTDRSRTVLREGKATSLDDFTTSLSEIAKAHKSDGGAGLAILSGDNNSPTQARIRKEIEAQFPQMLWAQYEPLRTGNDRIAVENAFGKGVRPVAQYDKADVILSLGSDFLGTDEGGLAAARGFSDRRRVSEKGTMNRLYVVENRYTVTGGMADHRLRAPASHLATITVALANKIAGISGTSELAALAGKVKIAGAAEMSSETAAWIEGAAKDLVATKGHNLVVAGAELPVAVQILVYGINAALGNIGTTVTFLPEETPASASISDLAARIKASKVTTLIILGGNPAYNAPVELDWPSLQKAVKQVIQVSAYEDETSEGCAWHVPAAHYLETWGDAYSPDGTYVPVQPMIEPLWGAISELQVLTLLAGRPMTAGPELVRETFRTKLSEADFESAWTAFLRDGFLAKSTPAPISKSFNASSAAAWIADSSNISAPVSGDGLEVVLVADNKVDDGRYVNNGWMQELPDPITKLTWDNAALISIATAKKLGVEIQKITTIENDILKIEVEGRSIEIPVLVAPGHADNSITIALGYGRTKVGRVGTGTGVNAYALRTTESPLYAVATSAARTGKHTQLALTHGHWTLEGRNIYREGTLDQFNEDPKFAKMIGMDAHIPPNISLYTNPPLTAAEQWGMSVDLSVCTGCNACVVACQSENNIPIVGKEQVINQREMHWIRIDRYFATVSEEQPDPEMVMQPMACQHCENAPCEAVCPVNATVHSSDGLNAMVYNRCIGTRYCANNCPYKVRRFNFFDYNKRDVLAKSPFFSRIFKTNNGNLYDGPFGKKGSPDTIQMQKNPNVTVRMRGVMEKCTFCVQRIESARIESRVLAGASDNVAMPPNAVKTACQQACPTNAIVFGDKNNPESRLAKLKQDPRDYRVLEYLNVLPRVSYMARIRNPNPDMPGAARVGKINYEGLEESDSPSHAPSHAPSASASDHGAEKTH